jgi:serine/threonine protein kinase/Flp pilus assembly protein TadD
MSQSVIPRGTDLKSVLPQASFDVLISKLADKMQAGEPVDLEEHIRQHPEHADRLRQLLPTLEALAKLGPSLGQGSSGQGATPESVDGTLGDFRILREVGRGGMGIVYEAEQVSLGRRVALKVLPFAATMDSRQLQRFQNEARAAAGLHHTNIVPVYGVGCERGVHFYAMQYIEGRSLADVIQSLRQASEPRPSGRREPAELTTPHVPLPNGRGSDTTNPVAALSTAFSTKDRGYFRTVAQLGIQAAEALDYAHQMGVIHRDVKPANLLIDNSSFTTHHSPRLWVTDFGLAQVQSDTRLTMTGDLIGTLRYMSPEQALAKRVVVDHRTDIYSLGATLYELLTLQPAYRGNDRQELLRQIAFEEPKPARRLNKSIPAELETIVLKAMEKNPADRYVTVQDLADDLRRFLNHETIRARRATLLQRARKWARRHRAGVTAAALALLAVIAVLGGCVGWVLGDRAARQRDAECKVREALVAAAPGLEQGNPWDPALIAAAQRAEAHLNSAVVDPELRTRVEQLVRDVDMLARLDKARLQPAAGAQVMGFDLAGADVYYANAFTWYGVDITALSPEEAADRVRGSAIGTHLIAALDDWAALKDLLQKRGGLPMWRAAHLADDDPWRRQLRRATMLKDRAALEALAQEEAIMSQPPANLVRLARSLRDVDSWAAAERLLRQAQPGHLADFWINFELGSTLDRKKPPDWAEAARFYQAALALRPHCAEVCNNHGVALKEQGKLAEAEAAFRNAIELKPIYPEAHNNLGAALNAQGRRAEAEVAFRNAIELKHNYPHAHRNLGTALFDPGRLDEAMAAFQEALRLDPKYSAAQNDLGVVLRRKGQVPEALAAFQAAARLDPRNVLAHHNLGQILEAQNRLDEAIEEYRKALQINPRYAKAHCDLGSALRALGKVDAAIHEYRQAIECEPRLAAAHYNLGNALLFAKQDVDGAIREYRRAIECDPKDAAAHHNLGVALVRKGQLDQAIATLQEARRLDPKDHDIPGALAELLLRQGRFAEARQAARDTLDLLPVDQQGKRRTVSALQQKCDRLLALEEKLSLILRGERQPQDAAERLALAELCCFFLPKAKHRYVAGAQFYADAFAAEPNLAGDLSRHHLSNAACSAIMAVAGKGLDAAALDDKERARLRKQALDWSRADLAAWRKALANDAAKVGPALAEHLKRNYLQDEDLASVRGETALARLPAEERDAWQKLWVEVDALLTKVGGKVPGEKK